MGLYLSRVILISRRWCYTDDIFHYDLPRVRYIDLEYNNDPPPIYNNNDLSDSSTYLTTNITRYYPTLNNMENSLYFSLP